MKKAIAARLLALALLFTLIPGCSSLSALTSDAPSGSVSQSVSSDADFQLSDVPAYSGEAYVAVHDNIPYFSTEDLSADSFETYGQRDSLGRCTTAWACVGQDLMPTEDRGSIGQVKPTGWHTVKYDCVDGKYLYNRCHLIGYQLTGENANEDNLITGTRYLNTEGMLPFENLTADYIKETGNHVAYRVTPVFEGDNLLASGVLMEGWSVEDDGAGVCFCVYAYNVQPGVELDYATGDSWLSGDEPQSGAQSTQDDQQETYVLNTSSGKFHLPSCSSVEKMDPANRQDYTGSREDLIAQGYSPCGSCKP